MFYFSYFVKLISIIEYISMSITNISCKKGYQLIIDHETNKDLVIIDVRTPQSFSKGHISHAVNIDIEDDNYLHLFEQLDREKSYLVYCRHGNDSDIALRIMKRLGFKNIFHLYQGLETWIQKDLPVFIP